jgi:hypothetical protein
MAFLPFTPFIRTEVFNMCMAALTLTWVSCNRRVL